MRDGCPFCEYEASPLLLGRYRFRHEAIPVMARAQGAIVVSPIIPLVPGHVLVVPVLHYEDALTHPWVTGECFRIGAEWAAQNEVGECNLVAGVGESAGDRIGHLHVHVIPRRPGDGLLVWRQRLQAVPDLDV